jgi:hypothetical protein
MDAFFKFRRGQIILRGLEVTHTQIEMRGGIIRISLDRIFKGLDFRVIRPESGRKKNTKPAKEPYPIEIFQ